MTRRFLRHTISVPAALAFLSVFGSSPIAAQTHEVGHWIGIWGLTPVQSLRTCISESPSSATKPDHAYILGIHDAGGEVVLQRELRVLVGEFHCIDIAHAELVAAGLPPDPTTGAITFRVDILGQRGRTEETVGANQTRTIGAVMSVDAATGKTETYVGWNYSLGDTGTHE